MTAQQNFPGQPVQADALAAAVLRFLEQNQSTLVTLLKLINEQDSAERIAALWTSARFTPSRIQDALAHLAEAERCLAEAPVQLDQFAAPGWPDLDAALCWMGARLAELLNLQLAREI
ncbi:hypothetical protein [Maritimibacter sp. UBA3975]|uniref:hypothetical protein n=1 Tax=Maritimibacter sp. UBA3975 TaxID=1946833 RepID=UPI000C0A623D|nr:hypothetical protein [Maritimibacter sp. UBA3975]MAM60464.1 hypothetical protein [Maritimibacter sp.]